MLISSKVLLAKAQKERYAIGAFNTSNLEITKAIFAAAENLKTPFIIQTSEKEAEHGKIGKLAHMIAEFARETKKPVALNLDHGKSSELAKKCIEAGYTSVMIDGSKLPYEKNIELTRAMVNYSHQYNVPVEGELGAVPTPGKNEKVEMRLTDPAQAEDFVKKTGVDFLAVAIGNVHGFYKGEPKLNFELLKEIKKRVKTPLVLHGGSGISNADLKTAISLGICKININTEIRTAFSNTLREVLKNPENNVPYEIMKPVEAAVQKVVEEKIRIFGSAGK